MKLYHYAIIFVMIALSLFVIADVKTNNYVAVTEEKVRLDQRFDRAIDDAVFHLVETDGIASIKENKERVVEDFHLSMYASMNITNDPYKQELFKNYIPVIAVTCEEGYYLYHSFEYKGSDNQTYYGKQWGGLQPYYYEDNDFIYGFTLTDSLTIYDKNGLLDPEMNTMLFTLDFHELKDNEKYSYFKMNRSSSFLLDEEAFYLIRKGSIISCIEDALTYYCNNHNIIAGQLGITYHFAMPVVDNSEWTRSIDNPSLIVLFQGYPYGNGSEGIYNRFSIAGSRIKKNDSYYLEQKEWYYLYHKEDCTALDKDGILLLDEPHDTVLDCVKKGAYACPSCIPTGVFAPDYKP